MLPTRAKVAALYHITYKTIKFCLPPLWSWTVSFSPLFASVVEISEVLFQLSSAVEIK